MGKYHRELSQTMGDGPLPNLVRYYSNRLKGLCLSQFEWHNLPDTIDSLYMEKQLLYNGNVAFYWPEGLNFPLATSWIHRGGEFTVYGKPTDIYGLDYNGRQIPVDEFHILKDNRSEMSLVPDIEMYAGLLAQAHLTGRSNLMRQNTPYIVASSKNEQLTIKNFFKKIFSFEPVIQVSGNLDVENRIKKIDLDVPFKANEIMEYRRQLWNDAISLLGISSETTKKERMISGEIALNRQEDTVSLNSRLLNRVELCNTLNELHGWDLSVNMTDVVIDDPGLVEEPEKEPTDG